MHYKRTLQSIGLKPCSGSSALEWSLLYLRDACLTQPIGGVYALTHSGPRNLRPHLICAAVQEVNQRTESGDNDHMPVSRGCMGVLYWLLMAPDNQISILMCTPIFLRSPKCPRLGLEGLYYWFLLRLALQSPACRDCPICNHIWSFCVSFLGVGQP